MYALPGYRNHLIFGGRFIFTSETLSNSESYVTMVQSNNIAEAHITASTWDKPFSLVWYFALMVPARNAISGVVSIIRKLFLRKSSTSGILFSAFSRMKMVVISVNWMKYDLLIFQI